MAETARKPTLVVLTGAGMSAESGIPTFRGSDGLWENHRIEDVATPGAWDRDPALVLNFYNARRKRMWECEPNEGHKGLARLEKHFNVHIITQNVDNLHERGGSSNVLHLHGELSKARSTRDESIVLDIGKKDILMGDKCPLGSQLRPHIVWFGEMVPLIADAQSMVQTADIFVVIGTGLAVYPAAGLVDEIAPGVPVYLIDPAPVRTDPHIQHIQAGASEGVKMLEKILKSAAA
ncbi:MAG: NAD-dependent deacylase [Puniceicoccales bacterium]|jgi:NAD-dependent deacetylase|nr:NAD-dependent deacylase [Puniceicoccales bacterium]